MTKVLPLAYQQRYEAFEQILREIQETLSFLGSGGVVLQSKATVLQQFFREEILSLSIDDLSPETQHWVQSYHVEMDKQLRLLGMDLLFLQAARQAGTTEQRRQQIRDRLNTLQRYCDVLLGKEKEGGREEL